MDISVYKNWDRKTGTGHKFSMRFPQHKADTTLDYERKKPFIILQNNGNAVVPLWPLKNIPPANALPANSQGTSRSASPMKWSPDQLSAIKEHFESTLPYEDDETYIPGITQNSKLMFRITWRGAPVLFCHVDRETEFYIPEDHPVHQLQPKLSDAVIQQELQDMYDEIFDDDRYSEDWDMPIAQLVNRKSPEEARYSSSGDTSGSDGGSPEVETAEIRSIRRNIDTIMAAREADDGPSLLISSAKQFHESWGIALERIGASRDDFPLKQSDFLDYIYGGGTVIDLFKNSSTTPKNLPNSELGTISVGSKWKGETVTRKGKGWIMVEESDNESDSTPTKTRRGYEPQVVRQGIQCDAAAVWTKWGWKETTRCGVQFANAGLEYESHIKREHLGMAGRTNMKTWAREQLAKLKTIQIRSNDDGEGVSFEYEFE